ncbi:hypothetical protein FRC01_005826 [Tulasnella sp. 417]|nr:hypothetical protein FRC01_005826 [Tulasnella sp. 417]
MNALTSIPGDLAAKVFALKEAGEELRQATTTNKKIDAMFKFGTELDAIHGWGRDQLNVWPTIRSFRLWEGVIDVLTEPPELSDYKQHETEVVLRFLCAMSAGKLVSACETYLRDHSATAYLRARLSKILQHQTWLSINTRQWKDTLHQMRQSTLHLIRLVLVYGQRSEDKHAIVRRLDREMYLSLIFSYVLDPHTYMENIGNESLGNVVEVLMALSLDNRLSGRAASWAVTEFGPSSVCAGFFKFSHLIIETGRESYFLAPLELAVHLLASAENHDLMLDKHPVIPFCINMYWSMVKKHSTIDGVEVTRFSSAIATFLHAVLGVVKDSRRRTTMICDLVREADLVILLGHMWLHSWGANNETMIATLGKHIATTADQDFALKQEYIKPAWLTVLKCLESSNGIKKSSQTPRIRALDQWTANFGRQLGWTAGPDAFIRTRNTCEVELVGCAAGARSIAVLRAKNQIGLEVVIVENAAIRTPRSSMT